MGISKKMQPAQVLGSACLNFGLGQAPRGDSVIAVQEPLGGHPVTQNAGLERATVLFQETEGAGYSVEVIKTM